MEGLIFGIVRYIHWYHKCRPLITNLKTHLQMLAVQKHNPKTLKSNESTWGWEGISIHFFGLNDYIPCPVAYNRLGRRNECLLPPTPRYFHS